MEESMSHTDTPCVSAKLLFSKSKVFIKPSATTKIPGILAIVERSPDDYLLAWKPESTISGDEVEKFERQQSDEVASDEKSETVTIPEPGSLPEQESPYAFSTGLKAIKSISVKPPSLNQWYGSMVINFQSGESSPPLWFHDDESQSTILQKKAEQRKSSEQDSNTVWGGDEIINWIARLVNVQRSSESGYLYILNDDRNLAPPSSPGKKQRPVSSSFADAPKTDGLASTSSGRACSSSSSYSQPLSYGIYPMPPPGFMGGMALPPSALGNSGIEPPRMDPLVATLKEAKWNILEKFSQVTRFSRNTAAQFLDLPLARPIVPLLPPSVQSLTNNETVKATMEDYDSARVFLAKWAAGLADQSEKSEPFDQRYRHVGIWGHDDWEEETALGVFEVLNSDSDNSIPVHTRTASVSLEQWNSFFDEQGILSIGQPYVRSAIFRGCLDPAARRKAWLFLTGVYPWDSSEEQRELIRKERRYAYHALKKQWHGVPEVIESEDFCEQKHRIDKDVHRTDRSVNLFASENLPNPGSSMYTSTNHHMEVVKDILCTYNVYNTDLGYVQGMSDLLTPVYAVVVEEELAFWAFVGFMDRMQANFFRDQSGMHQQLLTMDMMLQFMDPSLYKHFENTDSFNLFFCFRWLLVWFKREFSWDDVLSLWDVLFTDNLSTQFHLFVALAILDQHRNVIMDHLKHFDEILKYINDLAQTIDLDETLQRAEILFHQFKQRIDAVDKKRSDLKKDIKEHPGWSDAERRMNTKSEMAKLPHINALLRSLLDNSTAQPKEGTPPSTRSRSSSVLSDDAKSRDDDSFVHLEKATSQ
ncbi:putative GTPase activating protein [Umbelopsis sp. PMI_123]|nr:putative GTPase activating protein [Umbelopsis sp. PMI_123]